MLLELLRAQPIQDVSNLRSQETHAGICRPIIQAQFIRSTIEHGAAREDDIRNITRDLIGCAWTNYPLVTAAQDPPRVLEVEQGQADPVNRTSWRIAHAVVNDQPALGGLDW